MFYGFHKNIKQHSCFQHWWKAKIILEQKIRMISEDWSNDAEISDLHHRNKLHFTVYENIVILNCNNILQY